jgi:hypothetical protein
MTPGFRWWSPALGNKTIIFSTVSSFKFGIINYPLLYHWLAVVCCLMYIRKTFILKGKWRVKKHLWRSQRENTSSTALWNCEMAGIGRRGICSYSVMHYLYWIAGTYALNPPLSQNAFSIMWIFTNSIRNQSFFGIVCKCFDSSIIPQTFVEILFCAPIENQESIESDRNCICTCNPSHQKVKAGLFLVSGKPSPHSEELS